jgi:hypothetical protein
MKVGMNENAQISKYSARLRQPIKFRSLSSEERFGSCTQPDGNHLRTWIGIARPFIFCTVSLTTGTKNGGTPNNDETFNNFTEEQWKDLAKQFDQAMTSWEQDDDASPGKNANMIATSGRNAYPHRTDRLPSQRTRLLGPAKRREVRSQSNFRIRLMKVILL